MNLEVGAELPGSFVEHGEVVRSATPAGLVACATHFGRYNQLGAAHDAYGSGAKRDNQKLAGPSWEIYGHWQSEWDTTRRKSAPMCFGWSPTVVTVNQAVSVLVRTSCRERFSG